MSLTHIETIELGSSQSSITFSSIPQDYDDLVLVVNARVTSGNDAFIKYNGSTANLSSVHLNGNGSTVSSFTRTDGFIGWWNAATATSNTFGSWAAYISNYTASQAKSISVDSVTENNATSAQQFLSAQLWDNTSAITSIELDTNTGDMLAGSTASLYGITAGGDGTVTTS